MACSCGGSSNGAGGALLSGTLDSRYGQPGVGQVSFGPSPARRHPGLFWVIVAVVFGGAFLLYGRKKGE